MKMKFKDQINGVPCIVTVNTGKKSKVLSVEGIDALPEEIATIYEKECSTHYFLYRDFDEDEQENFFRGRTITCDPRDILVKLYQDWDNCYKNGTNDPNWCDGIGLNNIRKDIIIYKEILSQLCMEEEYPPCYYNELPSVVNSTYMANEADLIKAGLSYADKLEKEAFFNDVIALAKETEEQYRSMCRADKWGALRNIHWMADLPRIYREICITKGNRLKLFRKSYDTIIADIKQCLDQAKEDKKSNKNSDETHGMWQQLSLFDFMAV